MSTVALMAATGAAPIPAVTAIALGYNSNPGFEVWKWNDTTGLGAKYPTVSGISQGANVIFSTSGKAIFATSGSSSPNLFAWPWDDTNGPGTQYAAPTGTPLGGNLNNALAVTPGAILAVSVSNDSAIQAWAWNDATGFGTKYANGNAGATIGVNGISVNSTRTAIAVRAGTNITGFPWNDATGFGAKYPNVAASAGTGGVLFNRAGNVVFVGTNALSVSAYNWSDATGIGSKIGEQGLPNNVGSLAINATDDVLLVGIPVSPYILAYAWNNTTGFGTKFANPSPLPAGSSTLALTFNTANTEVFGASSSEFIYNWSAAGFGTKRTGPNKACTYIRVKG
jgi:hypothetical protein